MHQKIRKVSQTLFTILFLPYVLGLLWGPVFAPFLGHFKYEEVLYFIRSAIVLWILVFIGSLFFRRSYCSHICPMTGAFTFISFITKSKEVMSMQFPKILKYIILALWTLAFAYTSVALWQIKCHGVELPSIYASHEVAIFYGLYFISGILMLTVGKSKTQHYVCPFSPWMITGMRLADWMKWPSLRIVVHKEKCKECKQCNKVCMMNNNVYEMVQNQAFQQEECINCGACVEVCKFNGMSYSWTKE